MAGSRLKQQTIDSFEAFFQGGPDPAWPLEVFLEVSNLCNLKCAMCGPFSAVNPNRNRALAAERRGFLDADVWLSLEPVLQHALCVHAFGYGEPTLHPDFPGILRRLARFDVMIDFITNGMRLTQELCDAVVASRVAAVTVSISGATRSDYEDMYIGGEFDTVLAGLKRLSTTRARAGAHYPRITVNSIAFRHHIASLPAFVDLMADHGVDIIEVKKLMDTVRAVAGHGAPLRPEIERTRLDEARRRADARGVTLSTEQYERESGSTAADPVIPLGGLKKYAESIVQEPVGDAAIRPGVTAWHDTAPMSDILGIVPLTDEHFGTTSRFYCLEPFKTMYVRRGGLVKPCCFATDFAPALGDAMHDNAEQIWRGAGFSTIRNSIAALHYPKPACEPCIRRGTGPKRNFIRRRIRDYVTWAGERAGLKGSGAPDVGAPIIVAARAERRDSAGIRAACLANPSLAGRSAPGDVVADLILPIHNAGAHLRSCLLSIARHSTLPFRLFVIDDGSTDEDISHILDTFGSLAPGATVVRRADNRGFVRTVNEGFAMSSAPAVVILNSDTVVTQGWLERLLEAAHSRPNVATVTPLTNNGTLASVPDLHGRNELPAAYDPDTFAALVHARSLRVFPETPTGVGFCLLITRDALRQIGIFDENTFGQGYGEENDFCQRAIMAGFVNLIADHAFVFHAGGASFGDAGGVLTEKNLRIINSRYPNYARDIQRFYRYDPLSHLRSDLACQIARSDGKEPARPLRVLHLLHRGGGTEIHARDLAQIDDPDIVSYVSTSDGTQLDVDEYTGGTRSRAWTFPLETRLTGGQLTDDGYRRALTSACVALDIDVIHAHHVIHNTIDIADVANDLGIKYLMTLHDYYMLCPMYTLLDPAGERCGACIGRRPVESASECMRHVGQPPEYIHEYQRHTELFLRGAAQLFVPNPRTRDVVGERFPSLVSKIEVVEHGHRWPAAGNTPPRARSTSTQMNVAAIGGLELHKGLKAFRTLLRTNRRQETVFHLYGWTPDAPLRASPHVETRVDGSRFVYHGPYDAEQIVNHLQADGIDVGVQLAAWEETFSFTLGEFAAAGIPVIAGRFGAQGERVERCGLGWTVPDPQKAEDILAILDRLFEQPSALGEASRGMRRDVALPQLAHMWATYARIYREVASDGKVKVPKPQLNPDYVRFLASRQVREEPVDPRAPEALERAQTEAAALRERLRSPRHRVADSAASLLHRIPIVWPLVAKITDAILRREQRGK